MKRYYLAYGSNLNVEQMKYRCPGASVVGTSVIEDYELLFKGSKTGSYLTIERKVGSVVPVAVWAVTRRDEAALDRYEGYPAFYYKKDVRVVLDGAIPGFTAGLDAFVYIMHEDRQLGIPSDYYVQTCLEGYDAFGFSHKYLFDALDRSRKESAYEMSRMW